MDEKKLLQAFLEKPTIYKIDVLDNSMLPENIKAKKKLSFVSKPPSLKVLALCAETLLNVPQDVRSGKIESFENAMKYATEIVKCLAIMFHGKASEFPKWYVPFLINNLTSNELYQIFQESVLKSQSGFFLNCFQILEVSNPMLMTKSSTLSN